MESVLRVMRILSKAGRSGCGGCSAMEMVVVAIPKILPTSSSSSAAGSGQTTPRTRRLAHSEEIDLLTETNIAEVRAGLEDFSKRERERERACACVCENGKALSPGSAWQAGRATGAAHTGRLASPAGRPAGWLAGRTGKKRDLS